MPPRRKRVPGGSGNYWVGDFRYETWKTGVEDDFIVLPQIESRAGLERLDERDTEQDGRGQCAGRT